MKIRVKLALLAVSLCALAIAACCTVLIISANGNSVNTAIDGALSEQHLLVQSFQSALRNTYEDGLSDTTQQSLGKYLFRQYSSGSLSRSQYAMRKDGEYLHNGSELDPADILTDAKTRSGNGTEVKYTIVMHDNARHIVVGSANTINGGVYDIYLVKNIEQVYSSNASLTAKLAAVSLGLVLLTAAVLAYSVFRVLRPLKALQGSAAAIAHGDYQSRIPVKGKDEIAALSVSFNAMAEAVEKHVAEINDVAEARKLLLAALTHELKTPMTAIIGYSEALMKTRLTQEQREEAAAYINAECSRIERLSQKLMQLIALDGGSGITIAPTPVTELFESVEKTLLPIAERDGVALDMAYGSETLSMDADLMASVLINLFDNARKARAKHVHIVCSGGLISVTDDGCGIPADSVKRITEPFYMVDKSRSRKAGGVGLGLALVKRIVAMHGGKLGILSQIELGTCVEIELPQ